MGNDIFSKCLEGKDDESQYYQGDPLQREARKTREEDMGLRPDGE